MLSFIFASPKRENYTGLLLFRYVYENEGLKHLADSLCSCDEMKIWSAENHSMESNQSLNWKQNQFAKYPEKDVK